MTNARFTHGQQVRTPWGGVALVAQTLQDGRVVVRTETGAYATLHAEELS